LYRGFPSVLKVTKQLGRDLNNNRHDKKCLHKIKGRSLRIINIRNAPVVLLNNKNAKRFGYKVRWV
jgi:hypothetical protein